MSVVKKQVDMKEVMRKLTEGNKSLVALRRNFFPNHSREVASAWFHYKIDEILLNAKENCIVQAFRESGKTQFFRSLVYHCGLYPRQDRRYILFVLADERLAAKKLKEFADGFLRKPEFRSAIVKDENGRPQVRQNGDGAFQVMVRHFETGEPIEIRIETYGKGSNIRGAEWDGERPNLIFIDDIQDRKDMKSEIIPENDWEWFQGEIRMLGKDTRFFMIGNNLGEKCIISRAIVEANKGRLDAKTMIIPIMGKVAINGEEHGEDGQSNWPEMFPLSFIEKEQRDYADDLHIWYRERMCQSIDPERQEFKEEFFRYLYDPTKRRFKNTLTYITIDLAGSTSASSDYTAICVNSVDSNNNWFIREINFGRYNAPEKVDEIFKTVSRYAKDNLICVGIEQGLAKADLEPYLIQEMQKRGIFFRIEELKHGKRSKEERISLLAPRMKHGTVWFPVNQPDWFIRLKGELTAFPNARHDDLSDALAYQAQIALAPAGGDDDSEDERRRRKVAGIW